MFQPAVIVDGHLVIGLGFYYPSAGSAEQFLVDHQERVENIIREKHPEAGIEFTILKV